MLLDAHMSGALDDGPAGGAGSKQQPEVVAEKDQKTEDTPGTEIKSQVWQCLLWMLGSCCPYSQLTLSSSLQLKAHWITHVSGAICAQASLNPSLLLCTGCSRGTRCEAAREAAR